MTEKRNTDEARPVRILFVEDNMDHAELVMRGLREHGLANSVDHVTDGADALDYLHQRGEYEDAERPDVVLLDLRLPKIDGLEVLGEIKSHDELRHIPVVVLTTSEAETDLARAYEMHANAYLVKPVGFDRFADLMRDLGFFWLVWNKVPPND